MGHHRVGPFPDHPAAPQRVLRKAEIENVDRSSRRKSVNAKSENKDENKNGERKMMPPNFRSARSAARWERLRNSTAPACPIMRWCVGIKMGTGARLTRRIGAETKRR